MARQVVIHATDCPMVSRWRWRKVRPMPPIAFIALQATGANASRKRKFSR